MPYILPGGYDGGGGGGGALSLKADKIPILDWQYSDIPTPISIDTGTTLHYDTSKNPSIGGTTFPAARFLALDNAFDMFGLFSDDGLRFVLGYAKIDSTGLAFEFDEIIYDSDAIGTNNGWVGVDADGNRVVSERIADIHSGQWESIKGADTTFDGWDWTTDWQLATSAVIGYENLSDVEASLQAAINAEATTRASVDALKANIFVRQAQGITTGNNIQGMHVRIPTSPAYTTDWSFVTADGQSFTRTDNNFVYMDSGGNETKLLENGVVLIADWTIANPFYISAITGDYSNPEFFYRYFDIKDLDQRIGLVSALETDDKSSIVNAINSLHDYVDALVESAEVSDSPFESYADFLAGSGGGIAQGKYAYVTFTDTDTWPSGGKWDSIAVGDTWRLDCGVSAWSPTSNMTASATATIADQSATNALKPAGNDTVTEWLQSFRNNLKQLLNAIQSSGIHEGVCETAAGTAAKVVTIDGYTPSPGDLISIKYTLGNSASNHTLNINGGGALAVVLGGTTPAGGNGTGSGYCAANGRVLYYYNDSRLYMTGSLDVTDADTTTVYNVQIQAAAFKVDANSTETTTTTYYAFVGQTSPSTIEKISMTTSSSGAKTPTFTTLPISLRDPIMHSSGTTTVWTKGAVYNVALYLSMSLGTANWKYAIGQYYDLSGVLTNNSVTTDLLQVPLYVGGTPSGDDYFVPTEYSITLRDTSKVYKRIGQFCAAGNLALTSHQPVYKYVDGAWKRQG